MYEIGSSIFKKSSTIYSAFNSGIDKILLMKFYKMIFLLFKYYSSNFLKVPFFAIGGIGYPGCL